MNTTNSGMWGRKVNSKESYYNGRLSDEQKQKFHDLMVDVQKVSAGLLPQSIVHFMEEALSDPTKIHLLKEKEKVMYNKGPVDKGSEYVRSMVE